MTRPFAVPLADYERVLAERDVLDARLGHALDALLQSVAGGVRPRPPGLR